MSIVKAKEADKLIRELIALSERKEKLVKLVKVLETPKPYGELEINTTSRPIYSEDDKEYAFVDYQFEITEWNLPFIRGLLDIEVEGLELELEGIERTLYFMGVDL